MGVKREITSETEFIEQIMFWLPPQALLKDDWLQELQQNLQAAYKDTSPDLPATERWQMVFSEFGHPRKVAEDLISSQDQPFIRASYPHRVLAYLIDAFFVFGLLGITLFPLFFIASLFFKIDLLGEAILVKFEERKGHSHSRFRLYFSPYSVTQIIYILYVQAFEGAEVTVRGDFFSIFPYYVTLAFLLAWSLTVAVGYYAILESRYGRTIGKRLLRLRVVSETGIRISWQQAVTRNLSKFLSQMLLFDWLAGWLWKANRQRALELVAKTQVIYEHESKNMTTR